MEKNKPAVPIEAMDASVARLVSRRALLLPASLLTGWLWQAHGSAAALGVGAGLALVSGLLLLTLVPES